jgi:hypothetical protein
MNLMLIGAIAMASLIAALFFLRFWKRTGDRLFVFFAVSFLIEGLNRLAQGLMEDQNEARPLFYFVRFLSFVLILIGIAYKNLSKSRAAGATRETPASGSPGRDRIRNLS